MAASACAEQLNKAWETSSHLQHFANSAVSQEAVDTAFQKRWLGGDREYVVTAAGNIQPTHGALATGYANRANAAPTSNANFGGYSQFDLQDGATEYSCGPSPLTASQIAQLVVEAARRHGVDPGFALAIATTESRLDRARNSPKGARGPMQLMPSTAASLGVTDICDPAENVDGGVRFLKSLFETYRNPLIVAAAYNAGEANIQKYSGVPPFPETVRFVAEVVNRQLDMPMPGSKDEGKKLLSYPETFDNATSGVLATGQARRWVGGVMQF